jgi:2-iminobutanoate/2-iminopropanoate deaminase
MLATTADIRDAAVSGSAFRRRGRLADFTLEGYCRQASLGNTPSSKTCPGYIPCYHRAMIRDIVSTPSAPRAIGPYSQAVIVDGSRCIYCSGQIPLDPETGELVGNGDVGKETHRVMQNLAGVLKAAGVSLDAVVKTTIYLTDLANFAAVNAVYSTYFISTPPARATVQVAALPRGAQVEIDAVAVAA